MDADVGFAHKVNTDVYSDAQDLIVRHIKMIYAELNEDLKHGSRGTDLEPLSMPFPCLSEPDPLHYEPRQQSSIHTHQYPPQAEPQTQPQPQPQPPSIHPTTGLWNPAFPEAWVPEIRVESQSVYLNDCDGQDFGNGRHPHGHTPGPALRELDIPDTTTLSPSVRGYPDIAQEATPIAELQSATQRDTTRKTPGPRPHKSLPPLPSWPRTDENSRLLSGFLRKEPCSSHPQYERYQSGNRADDIKRRAFEPLPHSGNHDPAPDNLNQDISVDNFTLKEVMIRILHWIEACQKRLRGFPGETIANFRRALDAIPPEIKLEERHLPQLIKLARRLERFYWRIMRHEDFEYIRSACGGAQQRVETWSTNLRSPPSERHVGHGAGNLKSAIRETRY
ncbi:hypothetical protein Agabi119p4_2177 [Agaricus bisporus var. burnettii]|uniref:Uncharacterized protein n=1 Tax=Agaricus bisporus var. burnettii TaxID=192524 RepID=A0A8H7F8K2_AGABI|nr:hypothetical protein Agabi119p4_2177 [Agaricus bisporus var. burnettii]